MDVSILGNWSCHFQSRQRWVETNRRWPELFAEAVGIAHAMRGGLAVEKTPHLHVLRMPVFQACALDETALKVGGRVRQRVRGALWGLMAPWPQAV